MSSIPDRFEVLSNLLQLQNTTDDRPAPFSIRSTRSLSFCATTHPSISRTCGISQPCWTGASTTIALQSAATRYHPSIEQLRFLPRFCSKPYDDASQDWPAIHRATPLVYSREPTFLGSVCHLDLKMMMGASEIAALPLNEGSGCQSIKALNLFLPNFNVETKPALVCLIHRFPLETLEPRQLNDLSRLFCNPSAMRSAPIPGRVVRASCCRYRRWLAPCGCCGLCSVLGLTRHQS